MSRKIGKNVALNITKTILTIIFPIITYPYIFRVLGAAGTGRYAFSASIISYFFLIAGLGINGYAVREGSRLRDNPEKISIFASNIFSINIYSTCAALVLLFFSVLFSDKLYGYKDLLAVLSVEIVLSTFSLNWIYVIFEDYIYTTIVSVILQGLSLGCIILFVKNPGDLIIYTAFTVVSNYGYAVFTFLHAKKYISLQFVAKPARNHFKPILILFFSSIATTIYISSDSTLLGWMINDNSVGIYGAASKIYIIIKQVINAAIAVTIPRMVGYISHGLEGEAKAFGKDILNSLLMICIPATIGIFCVSELIIKLYAGKEYLNAVRPLQILSFALLFAVLANFYANCLLMALRKEKVIMLATICSALINISLNLILIPRYQETAAAFTTLCAEIAVFLISIYVSNKELHIKINSYNIICSFAGCIGIAGVCFFLRTHIVNEFVTLFSSVIISFIVFSVIQIVMRNPVFMQAYRNSITLVKKRK